MTLRITLFATGATAIALSVSVLMSAARPDNTESPIMVPVDGAQIFRNHCAVCHGRDGIGNGPAVMALKHAPPDLTQIARRNAGVFPRTRVKAIIAGSEESPSAHGSREMPIWGPIFHNFEWDQDLGEVRLENITTYLQSLQQK